MPFTLCCILENELHLHELVNSVLACPSQPFTIPKAASFLSEAVEYITKMSGYVWHHFFNV